MEEVVFAVSQLPGLLKFIKLSAMPTLLVYWCWIPSSSICSSQVFWSTCLLQSSTITLKQPTILSPTLFFHSVIYICSQDLYFPIWTLNRSLYGLLACMCMWLWLCVLLCVCVCVCVCACICWKWWESVKWSVIVYEISKISLFSWFCIFLLIILFL